jgi:DNA-binding NarL/FixJ family response regulator
MRTVTARKIRALVVDDMPQIVCLVSTILQRESVEVIATAKDGLAAVHAARKLHPDLIIMDVNMPSMNGLDATQCIRREFPKVKIIIMSADADESISECARECGADACINKHSLGTLWESQVTPMFAPAQ